MVVAGVIVYTLCKWARKVQDGSPVPFPGITNSDSIPTPGNGCNITGAWWQDGEVSFTWWDGTVASPLQQPEIETNIVITGCLDGTNLNLKIDRQVCEAGSIKFSDLGMPVDEFGMPSDLNWHWNQPAGEYQTWFLEKSTNLFDWEYMGTWQVWPGYTNSWKEMDTSQNHYYRATHE